MHPDEELLMQAKVPPHSMEAEQSVIGCLLLDNAQLDQVGGLVPDDFYAPTHRSVWSTICTLIGAGQVADVVTVVEAGGHERDYCNAMAVSVASPRHARAYAAVVRERSLRRALIRIGGELADEAMRGTEQRADATELIERAVVALMKLRTGQSVQEPRLLADLLPPFLDRLVRRADGYNDAVGTGLRDVDRLLGGGVRAGELIVIGARPSMGKSALALTLARNMAQEHAVLVCSMEDSEHMLVARQVAATGRINLADIRSPERAPASMWDAVTDGVELLRPLHLHIDDSPALTLRDVRRKIAQVRARVKRLDVVVVDYLQLMQGHGDNRHQLLAAITAGLKSTAKEHQVAVILLSQLNREADKTDGPPRLDHLRESGGIEEAADIVGLLWREHRRKPREDNKHLAQIEFAKHKNGPTDTIRLWFDGATQRFMDWAGDEEAYQ